MSQIDQALHNNIMVNTDYDDEHENDVYVEMTSTDTHINFRTQVYFYNWLVASGIKFEMIKHHNDEMRMVVWSPEDRVKIRMAFQLIKDRPVDDFINTGPIIIV